LRRSRARIVNAGDEARRRLERNLHDGRPAAAGVAVAVAAAGPVAVPARPGRADEILESAGDELSQALEELRELARGIHPAILTDRGLRPALEALATRAPLPVELAKSRAAAARADRGSRLLRRRGGAHERCQVRQRQTRYGPHHARDGQATIEVSDDGVAARDPLGGTGLRGLADRSRGAGRNAGRALATAPARACRR
jgi:signal transduction histidine kinase